MKIIVQILQIPLVANEGSYTAAAAVITWWALPSRDGLGQKLTHISNWLFHQVIFEMLS